MKSLPLVLIITALIAVALLIHRPSSASASEKASAAMLRQLEGEFMKAAAEHGSQGYLSYYADDAVEVPDGSPIMAK
jgi:hypothetical protein